jgi:hypothetical protein
MRASLNAPSGSLSIILTAAMVALAASPAQASSGHGPSVDQSRNSEHAQLVRAEHKEQPRQCMRRDTYNDIHYVAC